MSSTGIAIFAYNRPEHLRRVLDGLRENGVSHLYLFSDGPKNDADRFAVQSVRTIIDDIDWCRTTVVEHNRNRGLSESVTSGVERVLDTLARSSSPTWRPAWIGMTTTTV